MGRLTSYRESDVRYPALRATSVIFTGLGTVLLVVGGLLLAFGFYLLLTEMMGPPPQGSPLFKPRPVSIVPLSQGLGGAVLVLWSLGFLISGLQFLAIGGFLRLAIHVEENTRASAQCLETIRSRMEPRVENVEPFFVS